MMALINGWDLKQINNGSVDGQYGVSDLGASFGRTGNNFTRSKGVMKDYAETKFIEKVTPTYVDFVMHSRPFFLSVVNLPELPLPDADGECGEAYSDRRRSLDRQSARAIVHRADPRLLPRCRLLACRSRRLYPRRDATHRGI